MLEAAMRARRRWLLALVASGVMVASAVALPAPAWSYGGIAWGENHYGQLGNESVTTSDVPVAVDGLNEVISISGGGYNNMALLSDGTVMAWGVNGFGELCNGTETKSDVPVRIGIAGEAAAVSTGSYHSLILMANGTVLACGENYDGELGDGAMGSGSGSPLPVAVHGLSDVRAVSAAGDASLALLSDGTVMAWGRNESGQLGDGSLTDSDVPVAVTGLSGVTAIAAGHKYGLALLKSGSVMAWGENKRGQLGDGTTTDSETPVPVGGLSEVTAISAGSNASLALLKNGTVMTWGDGSYGQMGDGKTSDSDVPLAVHGLSGAAAISAGSGFSLALLSNGRVMGWGKDSVGQLGDGKTTNSDVPMAVSGLSEVVGIAATDGNDGFAYGPPAPAIPAPTITEMQPKFGPATGGVTVSIKGTNFTGATAVSFGSTGAASFKVTSPTSITAVSPAQAVGIVDVNVTTPYATTVASSVDRFGAKPTITTLKPDTGSSAGGTSVTVMGTGFGVGKSATSFEFGSAKPASVDCSSTTTCTVVAPAHAAGEVQVRATVNGTKTRKAPTDKFTYH